MLGTGYGGRCMSAVKSLSIAERKAGRSLSDQAYDRLRDMILKGELEPGQVALEKEIASRLDVSRTPVREALIRLEYDGLIEVLPRRGIRVLSINMNDIRDIFKVLSVLETAAAELLAEQDPETSDPALETLTSAVDDMQAALETDDLDAWAEADGRFHRVLLEQCGNSRLKRYAFAMWDQASRVRWVTLHLRPKPEGSTRDHRALVEAIRKRDADEARETHRVHRTQYMKMLMELLDTYRLGLL